MEQHELVKETFSQPINSDWKENMRRNRTILFYNNRTIMI